MLRLDPDCADHHAPICNYYATLLIATLSVAPSPSVRPSVCLYHAYDLLKTRKPYKLQTLCEHDLNTSNCGSIFEVAENKNVNNVLLRIIKLI